MENRVKKKGRKKKKWRIAVVCKINKIYAGENTSRDTSEEPQEPQEPQEWRVWNKKSNFDAIKLDILCLLEPVRLVKHFRKLLF